MKSEAELSKKLASNFIDYLKTRGYPEDSIVTEYPIARNYRADIAIMGKNDILIQFFELKTNNDTRLVENGISQLKRCRTNEDVSACLIFSKNESPYFGAIDIDEAPSDIIGTSKESLVFDYKYQRNKQICNATGVLKQKQRKAVSNLGIVAWSLAIANTIIGILSKTEMWFKIELNELWVVILPTGLFLIPYASEIKFLGMEIKLLTNDKKV